jgi:hypothetical protein
MCQVLMINIFTAFSSNFNSFCGIYFPIPLCQNRSLIDSLVAVAQHTVLRCTKLSGRSQKKQCLRLYTASHYHAAHQQKPLSKTIAGKISPAAADTCGIESARANVGGT